MRTRILRAAVAALTGSLLLVPTAASAGPVCEEAVHTVEDEVIAPISQDLADEVHEVEQAACPFLP